MGRKHYEAIAKILCDSYAEVESWFEVVEASHPPCKLRCGGVLDSTVGELVQVFKNDNPRFDKEKFLERIARCQRA